MNAGNGLCAIIVKEGGQVTPYFVYTDHLGSLLTLTDVNGNVVAEQNFDAWGRNRNPNDWSYNNVPARPDWLYRGFTGHEHVNTFALINMNGRMYDPVTCRMLSPDNYVPLPWNTQGYNRYGYANNNPLVYMDPDGDFFWFLIPIAVGAILNVTDHLQDISHAFDKGFWPGIGTAAGIAAVGGASSYANFALAATPILGNVVGSAITNIGNGIILGKPFDEVMTQTSQGIFTGIATGGISSITGGIFNKAEFICFKFRSPVNYKYWNRCIRWWSIYFGWRHCVLSQKCWYKCCSRCCWHLGRPIISKES